MLIHVYTLCQSFSISTLVLLNKTYSLSTTMFSFLEFSSKMAASSNMSALDVSNAIRKLTMEETRDLVFQMGVPLNALDDISAQFDGENRKQHFVQKWLDTKADASWDKLVTGLRQINMDSLATEIQSSFKLKAIAFTTPNLTKEENTSLSITTNFTQSAKNHIKVKVAKASIEHLEGQFSTIKSAARQSLTKKEGRDPNFVDTFRDHLLDLPVSKRRVHIRFFSRNEDEILAAKTVHKLFIILGRYCNYTNYDIIFHIVNRFCHELKERMEIYCDSLTSFEKATTVDVYLCAISAHPGGKLREGFIRMTMKMNKPPSQCTLYEIRELKESIEEEASLESYATYIETPGEGSVCVKLSLIREVGWMVGVVLTAEFRQVHLLTDIAVTTLYGWKIDLTTYLVRNLATCTFSY